MLNLGYRDRSKAITACVSEKELERLRIEKEKAARLEREKANANPVIEGVRDLRGLLESIEGGDAYKKRGARAVSKDLAKYANKALEESQSPASRAGSAPLRNNRNDSPLQLLSKLRGDAIEQRKQILCILDQSNLMYKNTISDGSAVYDNGVDGRDKDYEQTSPLKQTPNEILSVNSPGDKLKQGNAASVSSPSLRLPTLRTLNKADRKHLREMPKLSHYEMSIVSKIERKYLSAEFREGF